MKTNRPKLEYTEDFGIFEMHDLNRPLENRPELEASMSKYGFWPSEPIACKHNGGNKLKIVKGHHRFSVAKKLGIGVWYIVDDTPCTIFEREGNPRTAWNGPDFLHAYAAAKDKDCMALRQFMKRHGIKLGAAASLVGGQSAGSGNMVKKIKRGEFRVSSDLSHAKTVVQITDFCREAGYVFATYTPFVSAVSLACRIPEYDHSRMMDSLAKHGHRMKRRATVGEYLDEIESVYNGGRVKRVPISFRAKEIARERKNTFGKSTKSR